MFSTVSYLLKMNKNILMFSAQQDYDAIHV